MSLTHLFPLVYQIEVRRKKKSDYGSDYRKSTWVKLLKKFPTTLLNKSFSFDAYNDRMEEKTAERRQFVDYISYIYDTKEEGRYD